MTTTPSSVEPDLMDPALIADPYGGYGRMREQAPVLRGRTMDGGSAWYVTRQADVRVVLGDPRFVNNPASVPGVEVSNVREKMLEDMLGLPPELSRYVTTSILDTDGADHTRLRKLVSRAFTVRRVNDLRPRVEAITATLLDGLESPAELIEQFAYPLPITVICELVGVPEADRPAWREWGVGLVSMDPKIFPGVIREMVAHVQDLIARRRAEPADDLLTALIQAQEADGDQLSDDELVTMVLTLVIAGHETTAHLLGNGIVALLTHPDQLDLLRRDPSLWPVAVHELMRFCGPVHITRVRYATEDVDLGGVRIGAGEAVQAVLVSANFDPREYTDPERFDVTRRPIGRGEGHVGFGHGFHYCLGAALARQEGEVALRALFERFPDLALVNEEQEWAQLPGSRRLTRLPVRLA
ncbi:cytochrome P450 family protein [Pseudonocardia xinjiangensis]|uniref:Cytochrome P450 n=1 Tax=Pseudonocardia xinjiangensis TaxID=75289 RepID=A0ABX1RHA7_9PSEU|nr:cytochrome P450 [Pseudonocardia xinjiangensis]NMH79773.1 cytochrome P450 [Pseudonocardia xinjiangensis]